MIWLVTFDLDAHDDYARAHEILGTVGLTRVSPDLRVQLPETTAIGVILPELDLHDAEDVRDFLVYILRNARIHPNNLAVARVVDCAGFGPVTTRRQRDEARLALARQAYLRTVLGNRAIPNRNRGLIPG